MNVQANEIVKRVIKYIIEGTAVAIAMFLIVPRKVTPDEIAMIGITAGAIFAVLDNFSPSIAEGARRGAGMGLGFQQVRFLA